MKQLEDLADSPPQNSGLAACLASGLIYGLICASTGMGCLYSCLYRSKLRAEYDVDEGECPDFLVHCCCEHLALCQEYRELKNRGFDLGIGKCSTPFILLQFEFSAGQVLLASLLGSKQHPRRLAVKTTYANTDSFRAKNTDNDWPMSLSKQGKSQIGCAHSHTYRTTDVLCLCVTRLGGQHGPAEARSHRRHRDGGASHTAGHD
jgi:Cys-rich protein (TIGR01571 family)